MLSFCKVNNCKIKFQLLHIPDHPTMIIRLMDRGSGQREQAYARISHYRNGTVNRQGGWADDPVLSHLDLYEGDIATQVQEILDKNEKMSKLIK